ncbi:RNA-directed DNA polymerase, eukaryota [Tanacetum coccineum]
MQGVLVYPAGLVGVPNDKVVVRAMSGELDIALHWSNARIGGKKLASGFYIGSKFQFKSTKQVYRVSKKNGATTSSMKNNTEARSRESGGGIGRKSLYERWKEDYDDNPYDDDDDDDCEDLTIEQLVICDAYDIRIRGHTRREDLDVQAANRIGCGVLKASFAYLGSKVGENMSWIKSWDEIVDKMLFMAKMGKMVADSRLVTSPFGEAFSSIGGKHEVKWHVRRGFWGKQRYHRLYALEVKKTVDVASKLSQENLTWSFRRAPRSGVEQDQLTDLTTYVEGVVLGVTPDRWFSEVSTQTRWIKAVPIKVNIHAWKVRMDCLPTRLNISRRGIDIPSILCPVCGSVTESSSHLFFDCLVAKDNFPQGFTVDGMWLSLEVHTFEEWILDRKSSIPINMNKVVRRVCRYLFIGVGLDVMCRLVGLIG